MGRFERLLRWLFPPRRHAFDLANVEVDEGRGILTTKQVPPGTVSLSVSYGRIAAYGSVHSVGPHDLEVHGSCRVQAVVEQPWGLHRWWLERTARRAA